MPKATRSSRSVIGCDDTPVHHDADDLPLRHRMRPISIALRFDPNFGIDSAKPVLRDGIRRAEIVLAYFGRRPTAMATTPAVTAASHIVVSSATRLLSVCVASRP